MLVLLLTQPATAALVCGIDAITPVSFGAYDPFDGLPTDAAGSVTYSCSGALESDSVAIELSAGGAASFAPRQLTSGANTLNYNLYLDAARLSVWGDGGGTTVRYEASGTGLNGTHEVTIHGRIPAGQNPSAGAYGDGIVVTVAY
ncbi:MAG: spore coat protein U domain-containing protein [Myxococcales bacterium]|nr:spore coat protein U domain-containing protein [Myxococcales bacterium]